MENVTLCTSFYRNCDMLRRQLEIWEGYPPEVKIVLVDDGSPESASEIVERQASLELCKRLALYRIKVDLPWNREEARNLAVTKTTTDWLVMIDTDHVLPVESAKALLKFDPDPKFWYRFHRWRKGKADETRKKDLIAPNVEFGEIHPHIDSYLITKAMYEKAGGYDLLFSGCLGGGTEFLRRLESVAIPRLLPADIPLHVYTRSEVKDASVWTLNRDREEGKRRARAKQASKRPYVSCEVRSPYCRLL